MELTKDCFSMVNGNHRTRMTSFAIEELNCKNFNDYLAHNLECFLNENHIFSDIFNVEYMGYLTGQVRLENRKIEDIIPLINEFLKTNNT